MKGLRLWFAVNRNYAFWLVLFNFICRCENIVKTPVKSTVIRNHKKGSVETTEPSYFKISIYLLFFDDFKLSSSV